MIDYIEAKYPGYLLINYDSLEKQIKDACMPYLNNSDLATAYKIYNKMLSRDWNGQI